MLAEPVMNGMLTLACYAYVLSIILISSRLDRFLNVSRRTSRKFLHLMVGNLPFVIPFFTSTLFPALVAAPFVVVTFLASPYCPAKSINQKMKGLTDITEEGHKLGLVFYAISYTLLAFLFASRPYVIAAGVLPMAYGDATASVIGERFGKHPYKLFAKKSLEGSITMFTVSFISFASGLAFFSVFYPISLLAVVPAAFAMAVVATLVEGLSPMGFDNLTVPALSTLAFLLCIGGI